MTHAMTEAVIRIWRVTRRCVAYPILLVGVVLQEIAELVAGDLDDY